MNDEYQNGSDHESVGLPTSRAEVEEMYSSGEEPPFTKAEMDLLARKYFGLHGHPGHMRKHELIMYFKNPAMRPTLQEQAENRIRRAYERVLERREAIGEGLKPRPGRWRFGAIAKLARGHHIDAITGREFNNGIVVRDLRTREVLPVAGTTATEMKRRKQLPWYDIDRLPVSSGPDEAGKSWDEQIQQILDSIQQTPKAASTFSSEVEEILNSHLPE